MAIPTRNIPKPTQPGNPGPIPIKGPVQPQPMEPIPIKGPVNPPNIKPQKIEVPTEPPEIEPQKIEAPTEPLEIKPYKVPVPPISQDRVEWTPIQIKQLEVIKAILNGDLTLADVQKRANFPELKTFGNSGETGLETRVNDALTLGRFLFQGYLGAAKIQRFIKYHILTGADKTGSIGGVIRQFKRQVRKDKLGSEEWLEYGFDERNTELALEDKKYRRKSKNSYNRPTLKEREKAIESLISGLKKSNKFSDTYTEVAKAANPRLFLRIDGFYRNSEDRVTIDIPFFFFDMEYRPESKFSPVNVLGRNLKRYHYSGAEDSFEFKIILKQDHFSDSPIQIARNIAELTKASKDGETRIITFSFTKATESYGKFFPFSQNRYYVLTKAPFKPSRFRAKDLSHLVEDDGFGNKRVNLGNTGVVESLNEVKLDPEPRFIEQTLYLKRIADNPYDLYQ